MASRLKIYYPESQIRKGRYTRGGEWMLEDGTEYVGAYHSYITGEVFTMPEWNERASMKLIPLRPVGDEHDAYRKALMGYKDPSTGEVKIIDTEWDVRRYKAPKHKVVTPEQSDYERGYYIRYIVGKRNDASYPLREVAMSDVETYDSAGTGINKFLFKLIEVKWKLTGPEYDVIENGSIRMAGVVDTNRRTVFSKNQELFGVSDFLRNLREHTIYASAITGD